MTSYSDFGGRFCRHLDASIGNGEGTRASNIQQISTKLQGVVSHKTSPFNSTSDKGAQLEGKSGGGGRIPRVPNFASGGDEC